jgi:uncharacterized protein YqeY
MGLFEQLQNDLKAALRSKDQVRLTTIRSLIAAIKNEQVNKRSAEVKRIAREQGISIEDINAADLPTDASLSDADIRQVISREIKKRQESIDLYRNVGREDAAASEEAEIAVLRDYMPKQLNPDELRPLIKSVIDEVGATSKADMKKVMPVVMSRYKDQADGRMINQIVQEMLS